MYETPGSTSAKLRLSSPTRMRFMRFRSTLTLPRTFGDGPPYAKFLPVEIGYSGILYLFAVWTIAWTCSRRIGADGSRRDQLVRLILDVGEVIAIRVQIFVAREHPVAPDGVLEFANGRLK